MSMMNTVQNVNNCIKKAQLRSKMATFASETEKNNQFNMKRIILTSLFTLMSIITVLAAGTANIKFEKTKHNFGLFSESNPKVTCTFKFTNVGDGPLIIHQAIASCGCTVPVYPKEPIKAGESGEIIVKYDGFGKFPGRFRKSITIRTNGQTEITRLIVEGEMTPAAADVK